MANEVRLEAFHIKIRDRSAKKRRQKDQIYYYMGDIEGRDFFEIILKFLDSHKIKYDRDKKLLKSFLVVSDEEKMKIEPSDRYISGIVESGEFGYGSNIKNESGKTVHEKSSEESSDIPFYFIIKIPKGKDRAILITQRIGVHGLSSIFKEKFRQFLKENYHEYLIDFKPRLSKEMARAMLLEGDTKKIIFTKYVFPKDIADQLGDGYGDDELSQEELKVELSVSSKGGSFLNLKSQLQKFLDDKDLSILDFKDYGFTNAQYRARVQVKHGGRYRSIDLSDSMQIKPYYDIEDEGLKTDPKTSHPIFDSIHEIALEILDEMD